MKFVFYNIYGINKVLRELKEYSIVLDRETNKLMFYDGSVLKEIASNPTEENKHPANCVNCGAVLHNNVCEYCGTRY